MIMQLIRKIQNQVFLLLGRAILTAVDNSMKTQRVQLTVLDGETLSDTERFQEYGLETYPLTNAEAAVLFVAGDRRQGLTVCIHDRRYRPLDLSEGDVVLYTSVDAGTGLHRIHMKKANKEIDVEGDIVKLGKKASTQKTVCLSDLVDSINSLITSYNSHQHTETGGVTSAPLVSLVALDKVTLSTVETKAS